MNTESTKRRTSKFIREYGMTIREMSDKYNCSYHYIWTLDIKGELHRFIDEQEKKREEASCK
jgi:hypothetical protein